MKTESKITENEPLGLMAVIASCKLELKHLAPYLPYGLKFKANSYGWQKDGNDTNKSKYPNPIGKIEMLRIMNGSAYGFYIKNGSYPITHIKPIMRPLPDLKGEYLAEIFNTTQMTYGENTINHFGIKNTPYQVIEILFKHHFDVFGLIVKGLAIDANTIDNV